MGTPINRRVGSRYIEGQKQREPKLLLRLSENGGCAFDNKVALTDDLVIVGAIYVSASPIANRHSLGLRWGPR